MIIGHGETSFPDFCSTQEGKNSRGGTIEDDSKRFKSKNLDAERKRRQKLSDRLLELRSLVPNITNAIISSFSTLSFLFIIQSHHHSLPSLCNCFQMNKATIITDAITYIEELQGTVRNLSDLLYQIDASMEGQLEIHNHSKEITTDNAEEMKKWGIEVPNISLPLSLFL